jgi:hypothetical protein
MNDNPSASDPLVAASPRRSPAKPRFDLELPLDQPAVPSVTRLFQRAFGRSGTPDTNKGYAPTEWQATDWLDTCSMDPGAGD